MVCGGLRMLCRSECAASQSVQRVRPCLLSSHSFFARRAGLRYEDMGHYGKGELVFMDIENIHVVRSSFNKLVELCSPGEVIEGMCRSPVRAEPKQSVTARGPQCAHAGTTAVGTCHVCTLYASCRGARHGWRTLGQTWHEHGMIRRTS